MAAIRKVHGDKVQAEMIPGSGGIFDVSINGDPVYSKWDTGRFPTNDEILAKIAAIGVK